MPNDTSDPRIYLAAERTLLAWIRTGISVMAFGFVVARFGLFLRLSRPQVGSSVAHGTSPYLGIALVVLGVVSIAAGTAQYHQFCRRCLRTEESPAPPAWRLSLALAWALVGLGVILATVLFV